MSRQKGFTLVELSIVLVVVGLLIGGILAAQSMTSTAKVNAVAMQIGQFDAGVENFKTKYNYLPGDAPAFGGDGNGVVACQGPGVRLNQIYAFHCELASFWSSIFPEQYSGKDPNDAFVGTQAITTGANKNVPLSKSGKTGSFFIASPIGDGTSYADLTNIRHYYVILDPTQAQVRGPFGYHDFSTTTSLNSAVKPADLLALDKK